MEILAMSLLKTLASTCLKYYLGYLFAAGGVQADKKDLGYSIPSWFMDPGRQATVFYAYGTSVKGDEFESLEDARQIAVEQMVGLIRRSHQRIISEEIRFDKSSIKQQRLVDLFLKGEGLQDFVLNTAVVDKKQLVKVKRPEPDMRAFVRVKLEPKDYLAHQDATLRDLRIRLTHQKSEDIMEEMEMEMRNLDGQPVSGVDSEETAPVAVPPPVPSPAPVAAPPNTAVFDSLQSELDNLK